MTDTPNTWVAMTAATVPVPASTDGRYPAERQLIGVGLFIARYEDGRWRFARRVSAIPAGVPEAAVLENIADRLPAQGTLIGWHVDHALMPTLLDAAATAPPIVAHHFLGRLHRLLQGAVVDLALGHGTAALATIAADMAIRAPQWDADTVSCAWASGRIEGVRYDLADEALAIWRVFVRAAGLAGLDAEAATDAWVAQRKRLRLVKRAG
ncbi:hypothetical protein [Sphingomonas corticis]|uniref:Uncharacterized protein n=1 Tax=Sphingomonas corticis TaxID=2722791 RepID=A0ABX1CPK3_9SPHN|nr:hypothetical protein [Sphingomonas corticis]NJR78746.1 hypothetical protein [Sphingomonas corticis]